MHNGSLTTLINSRYTGVGIEFGSSLTKVKVIVAKIKEIYSHTIITSDLKMQTFRHQTS